MKGKNGKGRREKKAEEKKKAEAKYIGRLSGTAMTRLIKLIKKEEAVQYFSNYPDVKCKSLSYFGFPNHLI